MRAFLFLILIVHKNFLYRTLAKSMAHVCEFRRLPQISLCRFLRGFIVLYMTSKRQNGAFYVL